MARKSNPDQFTPAELELMNVLWGAGACTVQMVLERLPAGRDRAYTTVQTLLNILHQKGKVTRAMKERAYYYEAAVSKNGAARGALRALVDGLFGGSPEQLVLHLLEEEGITGERLAELQAEVEKRRKAP
jgi:predicted transcriptional regulator